MKAKAAAARFGELYEISKADWVREVTDGSKSACVVAHLYEDGIVECRVMEVMNGSGYGGCGVPGDFMALFFVYSTLLFALRCVLPAAVPSLVLVEA